MTMMLTFGDLLRRYRTTAGLTQVELAERAGLSTRAITALERGVNRAPRKETLQLLCEALQLSAQDRFTLDAAARWRYVSASHHSFAHAQDHPSLPPLVGRTRELALVERFLTGDGRSVLLLAGEPGIGKTRLLREITERAVSGGWSILQGGCQRRSGQHESSQNLRMS